MARPCAPDGSDSPSVLQVTVESATRRARPLVPVGGRGLVAGVALIGAIAVAGAAVVLGGVGGGRHESARVAGTGAPIAGIGVHTRGVEQLVTAAGAYRFPLGCMGTTITREALAAALRARTGPCWRYGVFVTAILRRVDGVWRLALEATSRSCPRVALPAPVAAQLAVCRR